MKNNKTPKIFLLIGLTKASLHWDQTFIQTLKDLYQTEDVIPFNIPGNGPLNDLQTPFGIPAIVKSMRDIHAKQLVRDDDRPHLLISISLGGMLATEWLNQYPRDFDRLVIINSSFKGFSPVWKRVQPTAMKKFIQIFLAPTSEKKEELITEMCGNNPDRRNNVRDSWVEIDKQFPLTKANLIKQTFSGALYNPKHIPTLPKLIIACKHDRLAHYSCSQKIHEKWGGEFHLIEDPLVGHGVHFDAPTKLATTIHNWWSGS